MEGIRSENVRGLLEDLARKPGHDEVKADIRELLVTEFQVERSEIDFETRGPEVRGRLDAILGRTIFEVKSDLMRERQDAEHRIPDYLEERCGSSLPGSTARSKAIFSIGCWPASGAVILFGRS